MKRVFLLFGIAAFCSASAQQKIVFDINKHLQGLMNKKKNSSTVIKPFKTNKFYNIGSHKSILKLSHTLPNGDKVFTQSQYNMPCIIPDLRQFTAMPNISNPNVYFESLLSRQQLPGTIPNAVRPYRLIASN